MNRIKTDVLHDRWRVWWLSIAAGAVQMGADVSLLEGHKMGGDCLNYGCVPSKALIAQAKQAYAHANAAIWRDEVSRQWITRPPRTTCRRDRNDCTRGQQ